MNKFIKKIVLFSVVALICFKALDFVIEYKLQNSKATFYSTFSKIYEGNLNVDLIINGSSKAYLQVSPKIIDEVLGVESYNLGRDGFKFDSQLVQYKMYRKYNRKPKYLVQIVSNETFPMYSELFGYMVFAPYLDIPEVKQLAKKHKGFSWADFNLPLIKYSSLLGKDIYQLKVNDNVYKGYNPQYGRMWDDSFEQFIKDNPNGVNIELDKDMMKSFENYIKENKDNNIEVFMVYPPTYYKAHKYINNRKEIIEFYESISKKYNVPFLNYSQDSMSYNRDYFYNSQHLNGESADLFTNKLALDLKKYINKKK